MSAILLVDDEPVQRSIVEEMLRTRLGLRCSSVASGQEAVDHVLNQMRPVPDLVLMDLVMPEMDGIQATRALKKISPDLPVIVLTHYGNNKRAMKAIAAGASDFLNKPVSPERLELSIRNVLQLKALRQQQGKESGDVSERLQFSHFIGDSAPLKAVLGQARQAASENAHVMIQASPGAGSSMLARAIHDHSPRSALSFMTCNNEQELKEALSGPMDSIGTLCLHRSLQLLPNAKYMFRTVFQRLLAQGQVRLVICMDPHMGDGSRQLPEQLAGLFSFRQIALPFLSERREDIALLARHFLSQISILQNSPVKQMTGDLKDTLQHMEWPGNVKQLQQMLWSLASHCDGDRLSLTHLKQLGESGYAGMPGQSGRERSGLFQISPVDEQGKLRPLHVIEEEILRYALEEYPCSRTDIARQLGIGRTTLYRKVQQMELEKQA